MLPRDNPVNVIAIVDNLELRVPGRLPKDAEEKRNEVAVVAATEETVTANKAQSRGTRSCRRKYVSTATRPNATESSPRTVRLSTRQQQTRRRNPVRSATRKESERRRQQQQQRGDGGGGGTRAPSREKPSPEPQEVGAEYEAPTLEDERQWRAWPAHGMHERPVYHPQFGLAAEYNGRLFASFDGQRYREVVDLEVVRVDPRPALADAKRAPAGAFSLQQRRALEQLRSLQRLRLQPCSAIPMCDVQPFKHNGNGKLFFVKAPAQKLQRVAAPPACNSRPTRAALDLVSTQVLDLSNKSRQPTQQTDPAPPPPRKVDQRQRNPGCSFNLQQWPTSADSLNLVRYFQNFGADGSIDDAAQGQSSTAQSNTSNPIDAHPSQR